MTANFTMKRGDLVAAAYPPKDVFQEIVEIRVMRGSAVVCTSCVDVPVSLSRDAAMDRITNALGDALDAAEKPSP